MKYIGENAIKKLISLIKSDLKKKLDKNQGTANVGKALVIGEDGNVAPEALRETIEDNIRLKTNVKFEFPKKYGILGSIAYGNGIYIALVREYRNYNVFYSKDNGNSWTRTNFGYLPQKVFFINGQFIITSNLGYIYSSKDGINWTKHDVDSQNNYTARSTSYMDITYGNNRYLMNTEDNNRGLFYSEDLVSWHYIQSNNNDKIFYFDGLFYVFSSISEGNYAIGSSSNGETWTSESITTTSTHYYIAKNQLAILSNNKIYRKKIGATSWDSYDLPSTGSWSFVGVQGYPDIFFSYNDHNFAKKFEDNIDIFFSENNSSQIYVLLEDGSTVYNTDLNTILFGDKECAYGMTINNNNEYGLFDGMYIHNSVTYDKVQSFELADDIIKKLNSTQPIITATGLLEGDGAGNITAADTEVATLVDVPNGIVKGDGNTLSAAVAGTDYMAPPTGGTTGQVLTKTTDGQEWQDREKDIFVVTISGDDSSGYTANKTFAEIKAAYDGGKTVVATTVVNNSMICPLFLVYLADTLVQFTAALFDNASATLSITMDKNNNIARNLTRNQDVITASGLLKGDGIGGVSAAVAGTDYMAPPTGGTTGQVLTKTANSSEWADAPKSLPDGGTAGDALVKSTDGGSWETPVEASLVDLPVITASQTDLTAGTSPLATGELYVVYE